MYNSSMYEDRALHEQHLLHKLAPDGVEPTPTPGLARTAGFEIPVPVWGTMIGFYALYFLGLFTATGGDGPARMVLVISGLFIVAYFVVGSILGSLASVPGETRRGGAPLDTLYGQLSQPAAVVQILLIPAALALFGVGIALIRHLAIN